MGVVVTTFLFNLANHAEIGRRTLEDPVTTIQHQLRALGHRTGRFDAAFVADPNVVNVVVEGFFPEVIANMATARAKGARFLILATEEPTEKGFNHGIDPMMVRRQEAFSEAARYVDGILHLVPGEAVTRWYGQFAPAAHAELGYSPTLERRVGVPIDHDFGFFGAYTPRRKKIIERIARAPCAGRGTTVRVVPNFPSGEERDREMSRCHVILQIRALDEMGLVSSSRCSTALHLGRAVVAEPHALSHPWDEVISFSRSVDSFISDAVAARRLSQIVYNGQIARFREKFSPRRCLGEPLERIGVVGERRAA